MYKFSRPLTFFLQESAHRKKALNNVIMENLLSFDCLAVECRTIKLKLNLFFDLFVDDF